MVVAAAAASVRSAVFLCLQHQHHHRRDGQRNRHQAPRTGTPQSGLHRMEFKNLVEAAEKWCTGNPFDLIFAEEDDERRLDFYAEPGVSFYVLCPGDTDSFVSAAGPQSFVCVCVSVRECVRVCGGGSWGWVGGSPSCFHLMSWWWRMRAGEGQMWM